MSAARNLIVIRKRHIKPPASRSFRVDLGLAAGFFGAWLALCGFSPVVAAAMDELRLAVRNGPYRPQWPPLGPAAIGIAGLILSLIRHHFLGAGSDLQERLQRATLLAGTLLALRLLALFDPLVYIFPFLTILWSPHALWALALVFLGYVHLPSLGTQKSLRTGYVAGALLAVCLPLYVLYTLYFCQVTMLHGDQGQYLRVTQSLVHDGDMDLANNLGFENVREFHVMDFGLNSTPSAPEGKIYSRHPIGLSIALVPAYSWGLEVWENPRLGAALFIALLGGICVPLLFLYMTRLGVEPSAALMATGLIAVTGPFFYYTNQIFPEIPALLIVLVVLLSLAHWQTPRGAYRSMGRWETLKIGLLTLLLCCLPIIHPRLGPLGLCCGSIVLLQAWHSEKRRSALSVIFLIVVAGLCAIIAYHYTFSEDWMGPLRPGRGPWSENPFAMDTWRISLPGHWLHAGTGILLTSPIYFFSLFGLLTLARLRDRRVLIATILYAATAGIFGLHTLWSVGHDLPGRFMMMALAPLAIGLAWALPVLMRRATTGFFLAIALTISLESVIQTLVLPEIGYNGNNLLGRSINRFYPLQLHFLGKGQPDLSMLDLVFWGVLAGALYLRPKRIGVRAAAIAAAALVPLLWSQSNVAASRWKSCRSPYMSDLSTQVAPMVFKFNVPREAVDESAADAEGRLRARPGHTKAGKVDESRLFTPLLRAPYPGIYRLHFHGLHVDAPRDRIAGHLTRSRRYTVKVVSNWRTSTNLPLIGGRMDGDHSLIFRIDRPLFCDVYTTYTGTGELALDGIRATYIPLPYLPEPEISEVERVSHAARDRPIRAVHRFPDLPPGNYRVRYDLAGSTFSSFFERHPAPIRTAVYTLPPPARPFTQGAHPPWWLSIPFAGEEVYELRFVLDEPQDVHVLLQYDGEADLDLKEIVLFRETYVHR
ncbi:MAG: hypothetical protein J4F39_12690 [Candidatus Latescibacteria bacterium]|nr:hypothetical protein [Candidatus Latescibacterota bacterium]